MKACVLVVSFLLAVSSSSVLANAGKLTQIRLQQEEIRKQTEGSTGRYVRFETGELAKLRKAQDTVFELLNGVSELSQLNATQQAELFNALESVKTVITANEADRQVCWREQRLGSHRVETRCATVAERQQIREGAHDWKSEPSICGRAAAGETTACVGRFGE
jgi:hypothetical protein